MVAWALPDFFAAETVTKNDRAEAEQECDGHQDERAARSELLGVRTGVLCRENEHMIRQCHVFIERRRRQTGKKECRPDEDDGRCFPQGSLHAAHATLRTAW